MCLGMRLYVLYAWHYVTTRERGKGIKTLQWFNRDQSNLIPKSAIFIDNAESTSTFLAARSLRGCTRQVSLWLAQRDNRRPCVPVYEVALRQILHSYNRQGVNRMISPHLTS